MWAHAPHRWPFSRSLIHFVFLVFFSVWLFRVFHCFAVSLSATTTGCGGLKRNFGSPHSSGQQRTLRISLTASPVVFAAECGVQSAQVNVQHHHSLCPLHVFFFSNRMRIEWCTAARSAPISVSNFVGSFYAFHLNSCAWCWKMRNKKNDSVQVNGFWFHLERWWAETQSMRCPITHDLHECRSCIIRIN